MCGQRVLGREDHVGRAEKGVGAGREDLDLRAALGGERHLGAFRAADPVPLHGERGFGPVQARQVALQPVGVGRDLEDPLSYVLAFDFRAAALASTIKHFLICEAGLT